MTIFFLFCSNQNNASCLVSFCIPVFLFTEVQKPENVHMITARMDTMNEVALLIDRATTTLTITVIALCSRPLALGAVLWVQALRQRIRILSLGSETHSRSPAPHGGTFTETTEVDGWTGLTTIVAADPLIRRSRDTLHHSGAQDRPQKPRTHLNKLPCLLGEDHTLGPGADRQALIQSAAPAAQAVAGWTCFFLFFFCFMIQICHTRLCSPTDLNSATVRKISENTYL